MGDDLSLIFSNDRLVSMAKANGLAINQTSWEDTARSKNSCWGPNISDMTLVADNRLMPMIRKPNYEDVSADVKIENFVVPVGNEVGIPTKRIPFKKYLENAGLYTKNEKIKNLYTKRDETILTSAQFCIVPETSNFNVRLFNYQSYEKNPAVLVIMVSQDGTSATCVTKENQDIFFNLKSKAFDFTAKRLSEDRKEKGIESLEQKMTQDEQERNALFIFQVPLKVEKMKSRSYEMQMAMKSCKSKGKKGIEHAVLSLGKERGIFQGTEDLTLERDPEFPIRCTIQYYQITDTLDIPSTVFENFSAKINHVYNSGEAMGSLVVDRPSKRKTESEMDEPIFALFKE